MIHELYINDVPGAAWGVWLDEMPKVPTGKKRGERMTMPGRDAGVWIDDGGRDAVEVKLSLYVEPRRDIEAVRAWLMGATKIRVSPNLWEWVVDCNEAAPEFGEWLNIPGEGWVVTVTYTAEPYRYVWPRTGMNITCSSGGTYVIENPFTADALPVITATFSAEIDARTSIVINDATISILPKTRRVHVIDCVNREFNDPQYQSVLGADGVRPVWPRFKPGTNTVKIAGSNISSVKFIADWRLI